MRVIQYSLILLLKYYLIATSVYKLFVIKFVVTLAFSKIKNKKNTTQSPLSEWKMIKLIQILQQKT